MASDALTTDTKSERELARLKETERILRRKNQELQREVHQMEDMMTAVRNLEGSVSTFSIAPRVPVGYSEATAVLLASDWHVEERVVPATVNYLNEFNPDIARRRSELFFQIAARMTTIFNKDIAIKSMILALLGDFFSNDIHEELAESNYMLPIDACIYAENLIASGIELLLAHTPIEELVIPCHSGNHGRTTRHVHIATERGHSLEYYMYHNLAKYFRKDERVKFVIAEGYHSYITLYDNFTIRFHHGHAIRYAGGVGGIFIPGFKAIAQWNKAKHAELDSWGHFHQMRDAGNFVSNGSLIGWNAFAINIKADFELPKQAMYLIDKKRGKTVTAPILLGD